MWGWVLLLRASWKGPCGTRRSFRCTLITVKFSTSKTSSYLLLPSFLSTFLTVPPPLLLPLLRLLFPLLLLLSPPPQTQPTAAGTAHHQYEEDVATRQDTKGKLVQKFIAALKVHIVDIFVDVIDPIAPCDHPSQHEQVENEIHGSPRVLGVLGLP